jgi:Alkylmercury lyase
MATSRLSARDWDLRLAVYRAFVATGQAPTYIELARQVGLPVDDARQAYRRLHTHHALFLEPGTDTIRMANPLSAVPTPYRVYVAGRRLWANCAWDSLGIPAMLHADARIEAVFASSGDAMAYAIEARELKAAGGVVHFPVPFNRWYDDLIHT